LRCVLDTNSLCCDKNVVRGEVYSIQLHNDVIRILCDAKWTRCNFNMMWYEVCPWRSVLDAISLWCDKKFVSGEVYLIQDHYDVIRSLSVEKCTWTGASFLSHHSEVASSTLRHGHTSHHIIVKLHRVHFDTDKYFLYIGPPTTSHLGVKACVKRFICGEKYSIQLHYNMTRSCRGSNI
jgi:hypothetical protein